MAAPCHMMRKCTMACACSVSTHLTVTTSLPWATRRPAGSPGCGGSKMAALKQRTDILAAALVFVIVSYIQDKK